MRAAHIGIRGAITLGVLYALGAPGTAFAQSPGYAIVTSADIRGLSTKLNAFAAHKAARGFAVSIFDENDWVRYYGTDVLKRIHTPEAVEAFLELLDNMPESPERFEAAKEGLINQYRTSRLDFRTILGEVRK